MVSPQEAQAVTVYCRICTTPYQPWFFGTCETYKVVKNIKVTNQHKTNEPILYNRGEVVHIGTVQCFNDGSRNSKENEGTRSDGLRLER